MGTTQRALGAALAGSAAFTWGCVSARGAALVCWPPDEPELPIGSQPLADATSIAIHAARKLPLDIAARIPRSSAASSQSWRRRNPECDFASPSRLPYARAMQHKRGRLGATPGFVAGALIAAGLITLLDGCGGSANSGDQPVSDAAADANAGAAGSSSVGGTAGRDAGPDARAGSGGSGGATVDSGYVDPGCPDAPVAEPVRECDPFSVPSGCSFGDACYPFVSYPSGVCDQETFGTFCLPPGTGQQGDPCAGEPCAGGFVCVVTGQGNQCVQLCPLQGEDGCPPGLFCVPVDVEGFGACF